MISPMELIAGRTYFSLAYEDERLTRMFIHSLEYMGQSDSPDSREATYAFRFIGNGDQGDGIYDQESSQPQTRDEFHVCEKELDLVFSFEGLASELIRLAPTNGAWVYNNASPSAS